MGTLLSYIIVGAACLVVGWVFLPEPVWFRNLWAKTGIADKD